MTQLTPYQQTQLARYGAAQTVSSSELGIMPIEYVTGKAEFLGHVFSVSPAVLIPRIETEELVDLALKTITERLPDYQTRQSLKIAEVGTGSGAISITLAKHLLPFKQIVQFWAGDISSDAIQIAKANQQKLLTAADIPIVFGQSDLLSSCPVGKFDIIIANLPYIPSDRIAQLDDSVKNYEPQLALDGGPRGLSIIYRLLDQAISRLNPNGVVLLEIDETHSLVDFREFGQYFEITIIQDNFGKNRFARLVFTQQAYRV